MRKWWVYALMGSCAVSLAAAESTDVPWYKKMFGESTEALPAEVSEAPSVPEKAPVPPSARQRPPMQNREAVGERMRQHADPDQMEKARAQQEELMKLGAAARNEEDPVKKEQLVGQIRSRLNEIADRMQQMHEKRMEEAGRDLSMLRERAAEARQNRDKRIEEQVQRILSGEQPAFGAVRRPEQPPGERKPGAGKGPRKPVEE